MIDKVFKKPEVKLSLSGNNIWNVITPVSATINNISDRREYMRRVGKTEDLGEIIEISKEYVRLTSFKKGEENVWVEI